MKTRTCPDPKPYPEKVRLVILDLDVFLYPYDKAYRQAVLRAWRSVQKEYGLPIFRKKIAQKLIEKAKEEAKKSDERQMTESALHAKGFTRRNSCWRKENAVIVWSIFIA